jgi:DNA repair exonuclease SbcCD ATPase subunit|tara:strand:+ start:188 stop:481 length:294 start_codon:yes stop_codon:yes gene_type:complete
MTGAEKQRLDRIEDKIDKLADAVVAIARAEEKLLGLEQISMDLHRKVTDIEERLRKVEDSSSSSAKELNIINKIFWIAISAVITGGIVVYLWGPQSL